MKAREINRDERQKERKEIFSYYGLAHRPAIRYVMLYIRKDGNQCWSCSENNSSVAVPDTIFVTDISYEFCLHANKNWSPDSSGGWYKGHRQHNQTFHSTHGLENLYSLQNALTYSGAQRTSYSVDTGSSPRAKLIILN